MQKIAQTGLIVALLSVSFVSNAWPCQPQVLEQSSAIYAAELGRHYVFKRQPEQAISTFSIEYPDLMIKFDGKETPDKAVDYPEDTALEELSVAMIRSAGQIAYGKVLRKATKEEALVQTQWALSILEKLVALYPNSKLKVKRERRLAEALIFHGRDLERAERLLRLESITDLVESSVIAAALKLAKKKGDPGLVSRLEDHHKKSIEREDRTLNKPSEYFILNKNCP